MDLKRLCEEIRFPSDAMPAMNRWLELDESVYQAYKRCFTRDRFSFFEEVKQQEGARQLLMYLFLRFAVDAYDEYKLRGIEDQVYWDTFSDLSIWCENCRRAHGEYGLEEYHWLQEHVQLRLFRLGRLQFQPYAVDRELAVDGVKVLRGQIVLNVHIPEGEPLNLQGVRSSFEQATAFFRGVSPIFICHSWLLDPKLADLLPAGSNILAFQQQFHILESDDRARQAEERVFGQVSDDPSVYVERTSLQRSLKAYLMGGGKLGSGFGIKIGKGA